MNGLAKAAAACAARTCHVAAGSLRHDDERAFIMNTKNTSARGARFLSAAIMVVCAVLDSASA
jgi:hypothetical protein